MKLVILMSITYSIYDFVIVPLKCLVSKFFLILVTTLLIIPSDINCKRLGCSKYIHRHRHRHTHTYTYM